MISLPHRPTDPDCYWKKEVGAVRISHVQRHTKTFAVDYVAALVQLAQQVASVTVRGKTKTVPIQAINGVRIAQQIADSKDK